MLSWENFSITLINKNKAIKDKYFEAIKPTRGSIEKGQMMAILGESGSGKTTFIKGLTGRIPQSAITTGKVFLDGKERDLIKWAKECSLIEQSNTLIPNLDIMEILTYVGIFHNIKGDIPKKAEELIKDLNLTDVMHTKTKSLSGGEIKRCAIAISLMADPSIILLDEPTSGLDTKNAYNLIAFIKKLAVEKQKIIIVSLHQPGNRILSMFDKIMLITKGQIVYCDYLKKMFPFFEKFGFEIEQGVSIHENISDIIDCQGNYDEINSQKEKLDKVFNHLKENIKPEYGSKPKKRNIFNINLLPNLKDIFYLTKRQFHISLQQPGYYLKFLMQVLIFGFICFSMKLITPDNLGGLKGISQFVDINSIATVMKNNMVCQILGFSSFRIFHPLFTEAQYVEKEIECYYYTPCSYWISLLIFLTSNMFLVNLIVSAIFIGLSSVNYQSEHFWYFTLLPLTYMPYHLFLTFICKNREFSSVVAYVISFMMQFLLIFNSLSSFSGKAPNSLFLFLLLDPQTYVIDIFVMITSILTKSNSENMLMTSVIFKYFGLGKMNTKDKIWILIMGLIINMLFMTMVSIFLFSFWYMPSVRLRVGKNMK
ncbi:ABC transporter G family member 4 [Dictyocoela muelleri]|nr:ABC transporter G family member 4 [Dictyocoela muelleri]